MWLSRHTLVMKIKSIAFDLDDTLLDTTNILVPEASKAAFKVLKEHGLKLSLDECEEIRLELIRNISHKDVFIQLAQRHGGAETLHACELANQAFYSPNVPSQLPLLAGAKENLEYLQKHYRLYIVTAGYEDGQLRKIESLNISHYFQKIYIVDSLNKKRKFDAFKDILNRDQINPQELLCIGNSLSSEIKDGKDLGCTTCYFEFGEDRGHLPTDPRFKPDFHIQKHSELIATCRL